jgi:hypothetical protein
MIILRFDSDTYYPTFSISTLKMEMLYFSGTLVAFAEYAVP